VIYNVIVTTMHGEHFQLQLGFKIDPEQGLVYYDFWLYNTFSKYGREAVLNWATSTDPANKLSYLLVGYYDLNVQTSIITCYPISRDNGTASIDFKGGVEIAISANNAISAEVLSLSSNGSLRIIANHPVLNLTRLYSLSDKVQVHFSYSDISKFDKITVTASNLVSQASQTVTVEF